MPRNAAYWVKNVKYPQEYFSGGRAGIASDIEERLLCLSHGELAGAKGLNIVYAEGVSRTPLVSQDSQSLPCDGRYAADVSPWRGRGEGRGCTDRCVMGVHAFVPGASWVLCR